MRCFSFPVLPIAPNPCPLAEIVLDLFFVLIYFSICNSKRLTTLEEEEGAYVGHLNLVSDKRTRFFCSRKPMNEIKSFNSKVAFEPTSRLTRVVAGPVDAKVIRFVTSRLKIVKEYRKTHTDPEGTLTAFVGRWLHLGAHELTRSTCKYQAIQWQDYSPDRSVGPRD